MKYLSLWLFCVLMLSSCFKPTYKDGQIAESVKKVIEKEYKFEGVKVEHINNTMWIYLPVQRLVDKDFELKKEALEKIGDAGHVASRVVFSSDAKIDFIVLTAYDEVGIELKMVRNVDDIKKVRVWYIAYSDFYARMDIDMGFNPEILGKKVIARMHEDIKNEGLKDTKDIEKYFLSDIDEDILKKIPDKMGNIIALHTRRIEEEKALIYLKTASPYTESLFLADVEFFDILKQILIIYLSKEQEEEDDKKEGIKLPVIAGYWNLNNEKWPAKYNEYRDVELWQEQAYAREIDFTKFISDQIERRIEKRFEEMKEQWNIDLAALDVTYLRDEVLISRSVDDSTEPYFDVDVDREIGLITANAVKNYQLSDVKSLIIGAPGWKDRMVIDRSKLLNMKPVKWKRIKEPETTTKKKSISLRDVLLGMFIPTYNYNAEEKEEETALEEGKEERLPVIQEQK
ncbi:hypothetical protein ACFLTD_02535 [Elusimicrobiota bacterium]